MTRRRSSKPTIAGVLLFGAGLLDIFSSSLLWMSTRDLPDYPIDISGLVDVCVVLTVFFGFIAIIGGIFALKRKNFVFVVIAAVAAMLGMGPFWTASILGLIALVAAAVSYEEFEQ